MPTSLKLPSIERLIEELDGREPGCSLYDMVTGHHPNGHGYVVWDTCPRGVGRLRQLSHDLELRGEVRDETSSLLGTICYECRIDHDENGFVLETLPEDTKFEILIKETYSRTISFDIRDGKKFGQTTVSASLESGSFKFPIWGYPHPEVRGKGVQQVVQTEDMLDCRMFLARMHLAACIVKSKDWFALDMSKINSLETLCWWLMKASRNTRGR